MKPKRNIRVSVSEEEYKFVREVLHKTKGKGRPARITEHDTFTSEWLSLFPDGQEQTKNTIAVSGKTAILSDIHLGVHDKQALIGVLTYLKKERPDNIILNGDIIDSASISKHPKRGDEPKYLYEVELCKNFLNAIATDYSYAKIYFKEGNHDERLSRYIMSEADQLNGLVSLESLLGLEKLGIHFVESTQFMKTQNVYVIHGHELKVSGGVNPSRSLLLKSFQNTIMGHVHKTTFSSAKNMDGVPIRTWTTGCLCKLSQCYMPHSNSNHGFAIVENDGTVRNHWINNGVVE